MSSKMTEEQVQEEYQATVGRAATPDEVANWTRYGMPGQITYQLAPGKTRTTEDGYTIFENANVTTVTDDKGKMVENYYKTAHPDLAKWMHRNKNGSVTFLSDAAMEGFTGHKDLDKVDSGRDGFTAFVRNSKSGGLLGGFDKVLGTNLEDAVNKIVPDEIKAAMNVGDLFGTGSMLYGEEFTTQGAEEAQDLLNISAEDYGKSKAVAAAVVSTVANVVVPGSGVALMAIKAAGEEQRGEDVDWLRVGENMAVSLVPGAAGAVVNAGLVKSHGGSWEDAGASLAISYAAGYANQAAGGGYYGAAASTAVKVAGGYAQDSDYDPTFAIATGATEGALAGSSGKPDTSINNYNKSIANDFRRAVTPSYYQNKYGPKPKDSHTYLGPNKGFVLSSPDGTQTARTTPGPGARSSGQRWSRGGAAAPYDPVDYDPGLARNAGPVVHRGFLQPSLPTDRPPTRPLAPAGPVGSTYIPGDIPLDAEESTIYSALSAPYPSTPPLAGHSISSPQAPRTRDWRQVSQPPSATGGGSWPLQYGDGGWNWWGKSQPRR